VQKKFKYKYISFSNGLLLILATVFPEPAVVGGPAADRECHKTPKPLICAKEI